ncbi:MAG: hypothetical protein KUG58_12265, partial [Marinosulfonomonas sp.]|nr:hypothetical protein [Marinosulfonomonas sp.]
MKKDLRFSSRKIQREIDLAQHAVKKFRKVTNTRELDYNWSAFIDHNYKAQDALIRAAKDIPGLRPWGHQTENFRRDDSILNHLFFSRNSDVHRDWEPANIEAKQHIIG